MVQLTLLIPTRKWPSSRCYFHRTNGAHAANSNSQMVQLTLLIPTRKWSSSRCYFHRTNGPAHAANSNSQMVQLTLLIPSHKRTTQTSACITLLTKGGGGAISLLSGQPDPGTGTTMLASGARKGKTPLAQGSDIPVSDPQAIP